MKSKACSSERCQERKRERFVERLRAAKVRHYIGKRLHRRMFLTLGMIITLTIGAVVGVFHILEENDFKARYRQLTSFFAEEYAEVWHDEEARNALLLRSEEHFGIDLELLEGEATAESLSPQQCEHPGLEVVVEDEGRRLGSIVVCTRPGPVHTSSWLAILLTAGFSLWLFSGIAAHRLARPLRELMLVTREIGEGKPSSRARLSWHDPGEVGSVALAVNDMAERIERQITSQKELLAGVSHEIRTPLARLRILTELLRDGGDVEVLTKDAEREIAEIDDLTGQLLATSRLNFDKPERRPADAVDLALAAVRRVGVDLSLLETRGFEASSDDVGTGLESVDGLCPLYCDPPLVARALTNLLNNANAHGGGVERLVVEQEFHGDSRRVRFIVEDGGSGFVEDDLPKVFDAFYRGRKSANGRPSLGLGLSLVRSIARAHHGGVSASNRAEGGARVSFWLPADEPEAKK